jgi:hypothetical protein
VPVSGFLSNKKVPLRHFYKLGSINELKLRF